MVLIMSRPVRQLEQELGGEASNSVFSWVGLNLFRNRGALIGATGSSVGSSRVAGQVMWVDTGQAPVSRHGATVADGMSRGAGHGRGGRWNMTWPLFDAMLDSLVLSTPNVYDDVARGDLAAGGRGGAELTAGWSDHWVLARRQYVAVSVEAVYSVGTPTWRSMTPRAADGRRRQ
jgi:hypothetical protein